MSDVAADLRAIADMASRLEARAIDLANSRDIPGGDALVNLAGVADMATWARRNDLADDALLQFEDPDELWSPFQMLAFWSEQWRRQLDMDHEDPRWRPSIASEAAFLRNPDVLAWAWGNEIHWDDFAADVASARTKLESVLIEGDRAERSRVTCPDCAQTDRTGDESDEQAEDRESHQCDSERPADRRTAPRLIAVYGPNGRDDRWKCPTCRHRFNEEDVRRARTSQMRQAGIAQRWMPVADALSILRKQGGWRTTTIMAWSRDTTEVASRTENGQRVIWWPDMWRLHLLHQFDVNEAKRKAIERAKRKARCAEDHGSDCWRHGRGCTVVLARHEAV